MKTCSYCGRDNEDDASQCRECGTGLWVAAVPLSVAAAGGPDQKGLLVGGLWLLGGLLVTGLTYAAAEGGGTYFVAWGAMLYGIIRIVRAMKTRAAPIQLTSPEALDPAYEAMAHATKLEVRGQLNEALKIYESVAESYRGTDAGRDALKSIESLKAKRGDDGSVPDQS